MQLTFAGLAVSAEPGFALGGTWPALLALRKRGPVGDCGLGQRSCGLLRRRCILQDRFRRLRAGNAVHFPDICTYRRDGGGDRLGSIAAVWPMRAWRPQLIQQQACRTGSSFALAVRISRLS